MTDKPKRPPGRPPGSKNKSTLERERLERERVMQEAKREITEEVIQRVEKMIDRKIVKDRSIILKGHSGSFRVLKRKGEYVMLESEQYGDKAYNIILKGDRIVADKVDGFDDPKAKEVFGECHIKKGKGPKVRKHYNLSEEDLVRMTNAVTYLKAYRSNLFNSIKGMKSTLFTLPDGFSDILTRLEAFGDVQVLAQAQEARDYISFMSNEVFERFSKFEYEINEKFDYLLYEMQGFTRDDYSKGSTAGDEEIVEADYNVDQYAVKSEKSKVRKFSINGNAIYPMTDDSIRDTIRAYICDNDGGLAEYFGEEYNEEFKDTYCERAVSEIMREVMYHMNQNEEIEYPEFGITFYPDIDEEGNNVDFMDKAKKRRARKGTETHEDRGVIDIDIEDMINGTFENDADTGVEPMPVPETPENDAETGVYDDPDEPMPTPDTPTVFEVPEGPQEISIDPQILEEGDADEIEKMIWSNLDPPPGALTQPFSNNYRTVSMGRGKMNPMSPNAGGKA